MALVKNGYKKKNTTSSETKTKTVPVVGASTTSSSGGGTSNSGSSGGTKSGNSQYTYTGGGYTIGSDKGKKIAQDMPINSSYEASDGSVWTKENDGSITVRTSGNTYTNAYTPSDYSLTLGQQMTAGVPYQVVQNTLDSRVNKANNTAGLEKYAYDDTYWKAYNYIQDQKNAEIMQGYEDKIAELEQGRPEEYQSEYDPRIDKLLNEILNREDFSYDAMNDPLYQQYAATYRREGDRAMRDTLAEAAASAGGMNTYAITAAQQANNYYNSQLNDKIPELYQLAYQMYLQDKESKVQDLGILQDMDNTQYNRYRDTMSDFYNDRNFAYGAYQDAVQQGNWQTNFDYNGALDNRNFNNGEYWKNKEFDYNDMWKNKEWDYNDEWANKEWNANQEDKEYDRNIYDKESAKEEVWKYIELGVMPNADLIAKAGMNETDVNLAIQAVKAEMAKKGSSGGGGGGSKKSGNGYTGEDKKIESTGDDNGYTGKLGDDDTKIQDDMSDYAITNSHNDDSNWVAVTGLGRVTYQELATMVENGTVIETIDHKNKRIHYSKA